jgi:hypothetical protein
MTTKPKRLGDKIDDLALRKRMLDQQRTAFARERPHQYILDDAGEPVPCHDLIEWGRFMASEHLRRVAQDLDEGDPGKEVRVSTVFLGLDHNFFGKGPPVLWETLVFGGVLDGEMDRYTSRAAALEGHQAMCLRVRATIEKKIEGAP